MYLCYFLHHSTSPHLFHPSMTFKLVYLVYDLRTIFHTITSVYVCPLKNCVSLSVCCFKFTKILLCFTFHAISYFFHWILFFKIQSCFCLYIWFMSSDPWKQWHLKHSHHFIHPFPWTLDTEFPPTLCYEKHFSVDPGLSFAEIRVSGMTSYVMGQAPKGYQLLCDLNITFPTLT